MGRSRHDASGLAASPEILAGTAHGSGAPGSGHAERPRTERSGAVLVVLVLLGAGQRPAGITW